MSDAPASGSSSTSKTLMWMTIGLFAALAVMLGGGLFMTNRLVKSVGIAASSGGNKEIIHTPGGNFRVEKEGQVGPSLPVYPHGSLELPSDKAAATAIKEMQNGVNTAVYHTTDSRDVVDAWYTQHLSQEFTRHDAGANPLPEIFKDARVSDSDIAFMAERGTHVRIVALSMDEGGTKISLIHIEKAASGSPNQPSSESAQ